MTKPELLLKLDGLMELPAATLHGDEELASLPWDSITVMGFIAMMNSVLKKRVAGKEVTNCKKVSDLLSLAGVS